MTESVLKGMLYGKGHAGTSCSMVTRSNQLELWVEGELAAILRYGDMAISYSGTDDKYLQFEGMDGGESMRVLTANKAIISALQQTGSRAVSGKLDEVLVQRSRRSVGRTLVIPGIALFFLLCLLGLWAAIKPATALLVEQIPTEWEQELGRNQAAEIMANSQVCADPALNGAMAEMGRRLVVGMGSTAYNWHVHILDSDEVNAFALPGGYVFVNRGLIESSDSASEVAGVLAHEFQHVRLRHGMKNVLANMGIRILVYAIVGDVEAVQGFLLEGVADLAAMGFSREQEAEADALAVEMSYKAEIDPAGFLSFMTRLQEEAADVPAGLALLSTHPATSARMDDIRAMIAERGAPTVTPFTSDWEAVRNRCTPVAHGDPDSMPEE